MRQDGITVTEYAARSCQLSQHALALILDELERVHRFVRSLNFSIRPYIFRVAREAKLLVRESFGDPKRVCTTS